MKVQIIDINGIKAREIATGIFESEIRSDIVQKLIEIERFDEKQPYAPFTWAGMNTSASGNVKHNRHVWKTDRGRGTSRYPKKRMSDKGSHFVWVAAIIPGVRGGRRAHPPKIPRTEIKINKKEKLLALKSALAMVASLDQLKKKYSTLNSMDTKLKFPLVIDSKLLSLKSKGFFEALNKIFGKELFNLAVQEKTVRAGRGKMRGRKYKQNAGMLLVIGNKEKMKISGIDVVNVKEMKLRQLAENGARITMFTEEAVKDIENKLAGRKAEKN